MLVPKEANLNPYSIWISYLKNVPFEGGLYIANKELPTRTQFETFAFMPTNDCL